MTSQQDNRRSLVWAASGDVTTDEAWAIQTERTRGEPPLRYVLTAPPGFMTWARRNDVELAWFVDLSTARRNVERLAARWIGGAA